MQCCLFGSPSGAGAGMPPTAPQPYGGAGYGGADAAAAAPNPASFTAAPTQPASFEAPPQQQSYNGLPPAEGAPGTNANGVRLSLPHQYCSCIGHTKIAIGGISLLHYAGAAGVLQHQGCPESGIANAL